MSDPADLFTPLPKELRAKIDGLSGAPDGTFADLPEWARTLVYHHSQLELNLDDLRSFALETSEDRVMLGFEGTCLEMFEGGQSQAFSAAPRSERANPWMRATIADYWDASAASIEQGTRALAELEPGERENSLGDLRDAVKKHAAALSDQQLVEATVNFADNLYKSACSIGWWDDQVSDYLEASAYVFSMTLIERGFRFQYLVDNRWDDMSRPTRLFPAWYEASGVLFTCPQVLVADLAERDPESPALETPGLVDEARKTCAEAVAACQADELSFVHLDTDMVEGSFDQDMADQGSEGVITMIRSEAPESGTRITVIPPSGMSFPAG